MGSEMCIRDSSYPAAQCRNAGRSLYLRARVEAEAMKAAVLPFKLVVPGRDRVFGGCGGAFLVPN